MRFSQRQGLEPQKILQIESIDDALKNSLWNVLTEYYFHTYDPNSSCELLVVTGWCSVAGATTPTAVTTGGPCSGGWNSRVRVTSNFVFAL